MVIAQRDQSSDFGKAMDHILVGVENILPDPFRDTDFFRVPAVVVYRGKEREPILQTDLIVFFAVARSGVHAAGAGIERNMLAEQNDRVAIQEWVPAKPLVHFDAGQQSDWFTIPAPTGCMLKMAHQVIGQEESSWCSWSGCRNLWTRYLYAGWTVIARFAGSVHGVVVQITIAALPANGPVRIAKST